MNRLTTDEFIEKSKKIHGSKYNYDFVIYKNSHTIVKIVCPKHGEFEQTPNNHLNHKGCLKCGGKEKLNTDIFIERSREIHKNKYDYSLVEYKNNKSTVKIICPEHGLFEQRSSHHFKGVGCPMCVGKNKTTEKFIKQCEKIHGFKYDYSLIKYKSAHKKVKIICNRHNIFEQTPHNHLHGNGCPICNESYGEKEIRIFLTVNNIKSLKNKKFKNCKYKISLPFDFYLPEYNSCIEFDGIQHFQAVEYFGGQESFEELKIRDNIKTNYCLENNIPLLRLDYKMKKEKINEIILKFLGF